MHNTIIDDEEVRKSRLMIAKIATALDCSEEDFSAMKSTEMMETVALLGLWHSIRDERDRDAVMAYVRTVAEKASVP